MPQTPAPEPLRVIETAADLAPVLMAIESAQRVALDTEFVREGRYFPKVCLIQLAVGETVFLVDPIALGDVSALWNAVTRPGLTVVLHAGFQDLQIIYSATGQLPRTVFDTQVVAGFAGFGYPVAYAGLVESVCGVTLSKSETFTAWDRRPLTPQQVAYAGDDVRYLFPLADALVGRLETIKTTTSITPAERLQWAGDETMHLAAESRFMFDPDHELMRMGKVARRLRAKDLAVLRELLIWREEIARTIDRPVHFVARDETLADLARRHPVEEDGLQNVRGLSVNKAHAALLLAAIRRGVESPPIQLPSQARRIELPPETDALVDLLYAGLRLRASQAQIAPELLGHPKDVTAWLIKYSKLRRRFRSKQPGRRGGQSTHEFTLPKLMQGWRANFVAPVLQQLLEGRLALVPRFDDDARWPELDLRPIETPSEGHGELPPLEELALLDSGSREPAA